ncbi:NAD-glutamate dehydrogenase [Acidipropionibacterium jensenii]|nr:NAD-glutamate dehydrogenase [Acidipropionibacterium jensenii]AZZ42296.1 NAD-glutamate dehydrogenase [Acidipropionibacterium jensenii]
MDDLEMDTERLVPAFLEHLGGSDLASRSPDYLTRMIRNELDLAARLDPDQVRIRIEARADWVPRHAGIIEVVTADRPFLVDTILVTLDRLGWSIGEVIHPVLGVRRDEQGRLVGVSTQGAVEGRDESWVHIEAAPALGNSPRQAAEQLRTELDDCLAEVVRATDDWPAMSERMAWVAGQVGASTAPSDDRDSSVELLNWLAEDNFLMLGYQQFSITEGVVEPVPGTALGICARQSWPANRFDALAGDDDLATLVVTKDSVRARVRSNDYRDYIGVRIRDANGRLVGEHRFLGLLGETAYTDPVSRIPVLRAKAARILALSGYPMKSHGGKAITRVLTGYPRDELFEADADELAPLVEQVVDLQERRRTRVLVRPGRWGRFIHVMAFIPRDCYGPHSRSITEEVVRRQTGAAQVESQMEMAGPALVRVMVTATMAPGQPLPRVDVAALEKAVAQAVRNWEDDFRDLVEEMPTDRRGIEFGADYRAEFAPRQGLLDLELLNTTPEDRELALVMYRPNDPEDPSDLRLKVFNRCSAMSLSQVMPHLTSLGVEVIDEHPHRILLRGAEVWLFDLGLAVQGAEGWTAADRHRFTEAFEASWTGTGEPDTFNGLVTAAALSARQVGVLRAVARYLRQLRVSFSQTYMARALIANPPVARRLVSYFATRFDPDRFEDTDGPGPERLAAMAQVRGAADAELDEVVSLDHDRILRMMWAVLAAMKRTNYYQPVHSVDNGRPVTRALAFKICPAELDFAVRPRPRSEIFVNSPTVSGTHLRFGAVARGGIRWSDRPEDFRTEVLGLAKAQMVKNAVIVPAGAKGGFHPGRLPDPAVDRAGWAAEGLRCYRIFIGALLDLTDNIVDGAVVAPHRVVRHDGDDPYLVVAADKGTASFSDQANQIAVERGFWLGDAFASGGSHGFDHKAMGITARGAWESVRRHLGELGLDESAHDFSCVGIGDMSGDVFGNGMLLSHHIRLVAAFNHRDVFVDPDPDPETSWLERRRLFELPRSSWRDYDPARISAGGGVWPRSAKSIPISDQMRVALGLQDDVTALTPDGLIRAILQAPVDLMWNGGVGTYVRADTQSDLEVGDRSNDAVRVTAGQVRARAVGEGGNLGWTQAARIQYSLAGGRINTDFIDNSAGVDTSDHEVNIKILLDAEVAAGRLDREDRDTLLASLTEEVAGLVLAHNRSQNIALACASAHIRERVGMVEAWIQQLEDAGHLDRTVETLPSRSEMDRRITSGDGLTSPELSTLLAWTKIALADEVLATGLPDDPHLGEVLIDYFPTPLRRQFARAMPAHRLHREITTMVLVNEFVDAQGLSAFLRLHQETGAGPDEIITAQVAARRVFRIAAAEEALTAAGLDAATTTRLRLVLRDLVEETTRWLLHRGSAALAEGPAAVASRFESGAARLVSGLERAPGVVGEQIGARRHELTEQGLPTDLAAAVSVGHWASVLLSAIDISARTGVDLDDVSHSYFLLAEQIRLHRLTDLLAGLPQRRVWDAMAVAGLRQDLLNAVGGAVEQSLATGATGDLRDAELQVRQMVDRIGDDPGLAQLTVVVRSLGSLVSHGGGQGS